MARLRLDRNDLRVLRGLDSGQMDPDTRIEHITNLVPFALVAVDQNAADGALRVVLTDEGRAAVSAADKAEALKTAAPDKKGAK